MLANDNIVAMNAVAQRARQLVDLYRSEQPRVEGAHTDLFETHAADHERLSAAVENAITRLGELPQDSDPEAEGLIKLGVELKSLFSFNGDAALADSLGQSEIELDEAIVDAMRTPIPSTLAKDLAEYRRTIQAHCKALEQMAGAE